MKLSLVEIEGIDPTRHETVWKIRALKLDERDPVTRVLLDWKRKDSCAYKAIMKVMRLCGQQHRSLNPKHAKRTSADHVYEMVAYTEIARVLFFYDEEEEAIIVCTNCYDKRQGDQDAAVQRCAELRKLYLTQKCQP